MGMPSVLKNFNFFADGISFIGEAQEIVLPKLERKTDEYRGGGMNAEVDIDMGMKKLVLEHSYGGLVANHIKSFGISTLDGVAMRFSGSYQRDDTGGYDAVEIVARGRHTEIDPGKAKSGDKTDFKVKSSLSYYKLTINGEVIVEIDIMNFVEVIDGVDRLAEQRTALGI